MIRRASFTITLLCLFAATGFAQYGKVSGRVQDQKSGEPLVGASVIVLGTTMGASTDADGRYTIQNISPGTYDIKATYVGYQQVTFTGIQVTAGLTREVNFALPTSEIETAPITIVATRPLIEKSATSMTRIVKSEDFEKLPVRGTNAYVLLQPGVVDLNGTIFIRGSRANEVGYTLDGAGTTNILGSGSLVTTIPEAVEEVLVKRADIPPSLAAQMPASSSRTSRQRRTPTQYSCSMRPTTLGIIRISNSWGPIPTAITIPSWDSAARL